MNSRQAALLVTHFISPEIIERYRKLRHGFTTYGDTFLLYQCESDCPALKIPSDVNAIPFTIDDLCELPYESWAETIVPGSNHFILLWFLRHHPYYSYYWNVEYDVLFDGDWTDFFDSFSKTSVDFITCHIATFEELPDWYWWKALKSPSQYIPLQERLRSFNPIYRISARAGSLIHSSLASGWAGHHEVVIPTLMKIADYTMRDLGGTGIWSCPQNIQFYTTDLFLPYGSMRHTPPFSKKVIGGYTGLLFHPIK